MQGLRISTTGGVETYSSRDVAWSIFYSKEVDEKTSGECEVYIPSYFTEIKIAIGPYGSNVQVFSNTPSPQVTLTGTTLKWSGSTDEPYTTAVRIDLIGR